jgi:FAD/FMN-containing dehydrogenase
MTGWYVLLLFVAYPLVGTLLCLPCLPCTLCRRPGNHWTRRRGCILAMLLSLWLLPAILWLAYSPLSVCSPRIVHSYPHDRSDDHMWEAYWCTRPCSGTLRRARNVSDVAHLLASSESVRVVGAGHSSTDQQCGVTILSIDDLCSFGGLDENGVATFGAGCTIFEAQEELVRDHGRQFRGYGSITTQRLGGAVSTSLHGQHPDPFANEVVGIAAVLANGTLVNLTRGVDDTFDAWPGSLGMLGVMIEVRLQTVALEWIACESVPGTHDDFYAGLTNPTLIGFETKAMYDDGEVVNLLVRTCYAAPPTAPTLPHLENKDSLLQGFLVDNVLLGFAMFLGRLVQSVPGIDQLLYDGSPSARSREGIVATVDDYRTEVSFTPHFDEEYAVPVDHCLDAMRDMGAVVHSVSSTLTTHFYIRRVDASIGMLTWAPTNSCAIRLEFFRFGGNGVEDETRIRKAVEGIVIARNGSGHFGKPFYSDPSHMLDNSPRVDAFEAYRREVDPTDKFQNEFTKTLRGERADTRDFVLPPELDDRLLVWRIAVSIAIVATTFAAVARCWRPRVQQTSSKEPLGGGMEMVQVVFGNAPGNARTLEQTRARARR